MALTIAGRDRDWYEQRVAVVSQVTETGIVVRFQEQGGEEEGAHGARHGAEETIGRSEIASRVWPRSLFLAVETAVEMQALGV